MIPSRNLILGTVLALAATPSLVFARPNVPAMTPHPEDFTFISLEAVPEISSETPAAMPEVSVEKTGTIPATDGMRLRVNTDPGNVHIFTDESSQISYRVRVEADGHEPGAEDFVHRFTIAARQTPRGTLLEGNLPWREFRGPFSVSYEIHVPRRINISVHTLGGNIEVQDIDGRVDLFTEGGSITVGRVNARVNAEDTSATSLGPRAHDQAGKIAAKLTTMGGHISIGDVAGTLRVSTSGGHITAGNIAGDAILHTGGGQIRTGRISGVGTLDTGGGNIMAWLSNGPDQGAAVSKSAGTDRDSKGARSARAASQFTSSEGDVVVFLPREMPVTVDAIIEQGTGHRIVADPALSQKISCQDSGPGSGPSSALGSAMIHCAGNVNGGGEVLHLRAVSGNIVLKAGDPRRELSAASSANWMESAARPPAFEAPDARRNMHPASEEPGDYNDAAGFFAEVRRRILESWWGGIPVDAEEMQKHLEHSVAPVYPDVARKAGVEGNVILRIYVSTEGRVTELKVLDGPPILARAAVEAVQQWQYHALKMNGQPVAAVTTMIVSFRLQ
jgi:TonB family protein